MAKDIAFINDAINTNNKEILRALLLNDDIENIVAKGFLPERMFAKIGQFINNTAQKVKAAANVARKGDKRKFVIAAYDTDINHKLVEHIYKLQLIDTKIDDLNAFATTYDDISSQTSHYAQLLMN